MSVHNLPYELANAKLPASGKILDEPSTGCLFAWGATVPSGDAGYAIGCLFVHTDGAAGTCLYTNEGTASSCTFAAVAALTADQEAILSAVAGTNTALKALIPDANKAVDTLGLSAGAATPAVALRLGATATEGLEIKVYDETITLTNAVAVDTTCVLPAGAVILSVQGNLETAVAGDAGGGDAVAKVGLGIKGGDEDAYAEFAALTKNTKADGIPDWGVLGTETTVTIFGLQSDGATAATEEFAAGGEVRVRVVYAVTNSLDDAA